MPFLSDFSRKNNRSHAHILSKKRPFSKKQCSHAHICQKNVHSLKTRCSHVILFKFFMKDPLLLCTRSVKNASILSKIHSIIEQKVNRMPYLPSFHDKNSVLMPIFCQKRPFSKKQTALMSVFCQNTSILSRK